MNGEDADKHRDDAEGHVDVRLQGGLHRVNLAALGTCQEITYRLFAESLGIPLNHVSVKVEGRLDLRGLLAVDEGVRPGFRDIRATVEIDSPAGTEEIKRLQATVERHCPVLDILRNVTPTKLDVVHNAGRPSVAA